MSVEKKLYSLTSEVRDLTRNDASTNVRATVTSDRKYLVVSTRTWSLTVPWGGGTLLELTRYQTPPEVTTPTTDEAVALLERVAESLRVVATPKSFTWRGYSFEWQPESEHPHNGAEMPACYSIRKGGMYERGPYVGSAPTTEAGMELCRKYAAEQVERWQRELASLESVVDLP